MSYSLVYGTALHKELQCTTGPGLRTSGVAHLVVLESEALAHEPADTLLQNHNLNNPNHTGFNVYLLKLLGELHLCTSFGAKLIERVL